MAKCNNCGKTGIEPKEVTALRFQCECGRYWMTVKKSGNSLNIKLDKTDKEEPTS